MKKMFSVALIASIGILTANSCNKPDPDPLGNYTCTCFITTTDSIQVKLDTIIVHEDQIEKSLATTYCNNTQTANTDTFGRVAKCSLNLQ